MSLAYSTLLRNKSNITNQKNWPGLLRKSEYFDKINVMKVAIQVEKIKKRVLELKKRLILMPPNYSLENLSAYFNANWSKMTDKFLSCPVPWSACDITANGNVAPCHVFYDLVLVNLNEQSSEEIWNGNKYKIFRDYLKEHKLTLICLGCCILYLINQKKEKWN